jgi:hypothetical protein
MSDIQNVRLAVLVALAEKRAAPLGRTAFMKLCYFLQTLRNVPLGYRFTLYSYGPFDARVLSDLSSAEALGGLHSEVVLYPTGYGYEIVLSHKSELVKGMAADFVRHYDLDINWVLEQFGTYGSGDLELLSTIIYVEREYAKGKQKLGWDSLARRVHEIKPHFTESYIREKMLDLCKKGLLRSLDATAVSA